MSNAETVERFIVEELDIGGPRMNHSEDLLAGDLLDSQALMELVAFLEERFEIEVPAEDLVPDNFRSIDAISAFVGSRGG